jgi:hypothetical protein
MVTRVAGGWIGCFFVLGAGFGGCGPQSPVVGEESGIEVPATAGRGGDSGRVDLVGDANVFVTSITSGFPSEELCTPSPLPISGGSVACVLLKARLVDAGGCRCDGPGSRASAARPLVTDQLELGGWCGAGVRDCSDYCICEWAPAAGESAVDCLTSLEPSPSSYGWCYIDDRGRGNPALVENCPEGQKQKLRILPLELVEEPGSMFFLACSGGPLLTGTAPPGSVPTGAPCVPRLERDASFNGFGLEAVNLEFGSFECASNICLLNHFQGRASCPYGQTTEDALQNPSCFLPGSDQPVTVPVDPQLVARPADETAICSCRCDGADPDQSYCACPSGMECAPLVRDIGVDGLGTSLYIVGSYCIPSGTEYDPMYPPDPQVCVSNEMNCGDPRPY